MSDELEVIDYDNSEGPDPNDLMRERSGNIASTDPLISVFYDLLRDHIKPGDLETVIRSAEQHNGKICKFTNGWLAKYAEDLATRIRDLQPK